MPRSPVRVLQNKSFRLGMAILTSMIGILSLFFYIIRALDINPSPDAEQVMLFTGLLALPAVLVEIFLRSGAGLLYSGIATLFAVLSFRDGVNGRLESWLMALGMLWASVLAARALVRRERDLAFRLRNMVTEIEEEIRSLEADREKLSLRALQNHEKSGIYRLLEHVAGEFNAPQYLEDIQATLNTLTLRSAAVIPEPSALCALHLFKGPDRDEIITGHSNQDEEVSDAPVLLVLDEHLAKTKRPFIAADISLELPVETTAPAGPYKSVIAVPLVRTERDEERVRTEALGVLRMATDQKGGFGVEHLRVLSTLGDLAGAVVTNSLLYQVTQKEATTDSLTGLYVQRYFRERFEDELRRAGRLGKPLSFLMCDIDHFKRYNDSYGHPVGDLVLKAIARQLRDCTRNVDFLARYGGEEFAVVLPETETAGAVHVAERIRERVKATRIAIVEEETAVTISIGVASFPLHGTKAEEILEKADQALYRAKEGGRNKVVVYEEGAS